jgi:hypothetical protein
MESSREQQGVDENVRDDQETEVRCLHDLERTARSDRGLLGDASAPCGES